MDMFISAILVCAVVALLGYGLYIVCTKFLEKFPPALWICGVLMIIIILMAASKLFGSSSGGKFHFGW